MAELWERNPIPSFSWAVLVEAEVRGLRLEEVVAQRSQEEVEVQCCLEVEAAERSLLEEVAELYGRL